MTVSGMNSSAAGTLFSSLSTNGNSGLYTAISDMGSIKNGSYGRLLNSYYNQTGSQAVSNAGRAKASAGTDNTSRGYTERYLKEQEAKKNRVDSKNNSTTNANTDSNAKVAANANAMVEAIDKLNASDTFKTDVSGNYNVDEIYKTVKSYVDAYNNTIDGAKTTTVSGVNSNVSSMTNITSVNAKSLSDMGITVGNDKKLSLDETAFKNADMSKVKETFGKANYGYSVRTNAYMANYYAKSAQSSSATYGQNANYNMSDVLSSFSSYM